MQSNTAEKNKNNDTVQSIEPELSPTEAGSSQSADDTTRSPVTVPTGIKIMIGGAVVLVLMIIAVMLFAVNDNSGNEDSPEYVDPVSLVGSKSTDESIDAESSIDTPSSEHVTSESDLASSYDEPVLNNQLNRSQELVTKNIDYELEEIKRTLDEQGIDMAQLNEMLMRFRDEDFKKVVQQIQMLSGDIKQIEHLVYRHYQQLKSTKKTSKSRRSPSKPPFSLVSIDVWGGKTSAVIQMNGRTSFADVGDVRAGWRIVSIDRPNCLAAVDVISNRQKKICMKGASS